MKATLTSAISMAAILGSGGAALAVNATVLDPQSDSTATTSEAPAPDTSVAAPSLGVDEFQIPGVGLVSMSTVDGVLFLRSVDANDGVSYTVTEVAPGEYEIRFESAGQVVTFTARLVDGQIMTTATGINTPPPAATPTNPADPANPANPASPGVPPPAGGSGVVSSPGSGGSSTPRHSDDDDDDNDEREDHGDDDDD